jgi:translation initiation factor 2 beta subunit (eIF-2beta)/eIF-5
MKTLFSENDFNTFANNMIGGYHRSMDQVVRDAQQLLNILENSLENSQHSNDSNVLISVQFISNNMSQNKVQFN